MEFSHKSVMLNECLQALDIKPNGVYVDGTAGGAGHSKEIAKHLGSGMLYAFDQDPDAVKIATERLMGLPAEVIKSNFQYAKEELEKRGIERIDGVLLDLGVSSHQLDTRQRGFSYHDDAPLDMRMSQSGPSAADMVAELSREELADILRKYGEEKDAWQIAGKIVMQRQESPIVTTAQLAEVILSALPPKRRRSAKNPARKSFQALRIAVNEELDVLESAMKSLFEMLSPKGRMVVISFHSLEDRIVKQQFRQWCIACTCPRDLPICVCGGQAMGKLVGKNPMVATQEELENNKRSRSAKLRVIEKV